MLNAEAADMHALPTPPETETGKAAQVVCCPGSLVAFDVAENFANLM